MHSQDAESRLAGALDRHQLLTAGTIASATRTTDLISALSYLGISSNNIEDWQHFASKLLGMQTLDRGGKNIAFRMDDQAQRLILSLIHI